MGNPKKDWDSVDWTLSNQQIAKKLPAKEWTVAKWRTKLGHGKSRTTPSKERSDRDVLIARLKSPEMRQKSKVRTNPHLFNQKYVEWKRTGGKRGTGGEYCNVTTGLSNVRKGKSKKLKGRGLL